MFGKLILVSLAICSIVGCSSLQLERGHYLSGIDRNQVY